MNIWKYIGEFLLFRRLFGSNKRNESHNDVSDAPINSLGSGRNSAGRFDRYGNGAYRQSSPYKGDPYYDKDMYDEEVYDEIDDFDSDDPYTDEGDFDDYGTDSWCDPDDDF